MATLFRYFLSSLLPCLFLLPWFLVLWYHQLVWEFPRGACFLGSLGVGFFIFPPRAQACRSGQDLMCVWPFFPPRARFTVPTPYSVPPFPHVLQLLLFIYLNDQLNYIYRWFSTKKREEEEDLWINYMRGCFE